MYFPFDFIFDFCLLIFIDFFFFYLIKYFIVHTIYIYINAIYIVYKIRKYDSTGLEHKYHFSCGMGYNRRGICFLKGEKTMRVYGAVGDRKPD